MKTEAGQRMLESLPVETESRTPKDYSRILRAIQAGEAPPSPHFQAETLDAIEALPQPVIASVRGHSLV